MKGEPARWDAHRRKIVGRLRDARAAVRRAEVLVLDRVMAWADMDAAQAEDLLDDPPADFASSRRREDEAGAMLFKVKAAARDLRRARRSLEERESMALRGKLPSEDHS